MATPLYPTIADYPNASGLLPMAYAIRDSVLIINPFFLILIGMLIVLSVSSYYLYVSFSGKTRFFNSLLASTFAVTVVSFFMSLAELINPLHVITFIALTILIYVISSYYR